MIDDLPELADPTRPSDSPDVGLAGPTRAIVHLDRIAANLRGIREKVGPDRGILMAVKADAYGHGAVEVSRYVEREKLADWFGVATVGEGVELRRAGITSPIFKLSPALPAEVAPALEARLTLAVASVAEADAVEAAAADLAAGAGNGGPGDGRHGCRQGDGRGNEGSRGDGDYRDGRRTHRDRGVGRVAIHVAIDSGMGRIGLAPGDVEGFAEHVRDRCPHLRVQGAFTHFAVSDSADPEVIAFTEGQLTVLRQGVAALSENLGYMVEIVHAANSGGVLGHPGSWGNLVRPGIMTYGYYPDPSTPRTIELRPALEWRAPVTFVKRVKAGETVSYGRTWTASEDTWVATLPVGYADGYRRLLSNTGRVLAAGREFVVAGRVCMDQTMIDLGPAGVGGPALQVGDEVVLLGESEQARYTADEMAADLDTIPYEVLTLIGRRVRREYRTSAPTTRT